MALWGRVPKTAQHAGQASASARMANEKGLDGQDLLYSSGPLSRFVYSLGVSKVTLHERGSPTCLRLLKSRTSGAWAHPCSPQSRPSQCAVLTMLLVILPLLYRGPSLESKSTMHC